MANPQPDHHIRISNELAEAFFKRRLSGREWQVIWVVLRNTWGYQNGPGDSKNRKKMNAISKTRFSELTGIPRQKCQEILCGLVKKKILLKSITQKGNTFFATYGINKDFEKWQVLPKKVTVTQKGNRVLPKKVTHTFKNKLKNNPPLVSPPTGGDDYPFQLACLFFQSIQVDNPKFKKPDLLKWAGAIDKLLRLDKRDPIELENLWDWIRQDDFWSLNVLSPLKLRRKDKDGICYYDRLLGRMERDGQQDGNGKRWKFNPDDFA